MAALAAARAPVSAAGGQPLGVGEEASLGAGAAG
jgi:hypothetical protein